MAHSGCSIEDSGHAVCFICLAYAGCLWIAARLVSAFFNELLAARLGQLSGVSVVVGAKHSDPADEVGHAPGNAEEHHDKDHVAIQLRVETGV